jgi:hypothetical protein
MTKKADDFLADRKRAYTLSFPLDSEAVKAVLKDLEIFCRANESCFHQDPRIHAVLEGRREVYLRIMDHLGMDFESFKAKYKEGRKVI